MQQELLQHLASFVGFHSVSDRTEEKERALQWAEETFLSTSHAAVHRGAVSGAPYVYLEHPHPDFLWFAHVDVVPGAPEQFTMRIEGERAYGRGTKDMKGGAIPFLLAYKHLTEEGIQSRTSILLTSDEETAGPTIPHLLDRGVLHTPVAFTPDTGSNPGIITEHIVQKIRPGALNKIPHGRMRNPHRIIFVLNHYLFLNNHYYSPDSYKQSADGCLPA